MRTLTARDTALLLDIAYYLQHGGLHARGQALCTDLHTLLQRHGKDVTVLSDEQVAQMNADIAAAEAAEAAALVTDSAQVLRAAAQMVQDWPVDAAPGNTRPEWERERRADGNRPPDDGTEDGWDTAPSGDEWLTDTIRAVTQIGEHPPVLGDITRLAAVLAALLQAIHDERGEIAVRLDALLRQQMANSL